MPYAIRSRLRVLAMLYYPDTRNRNVKYSFLFRIDMRMPSLTMIAIG